MSENLESHLAAWRQSMQAADIGPGPLRDELECHLRDSIEARVRAGMDAEAAFAAATEKLGPPKALRQEYNAALPRWTRVKRFLGRRVELFPTDMRVGAWAAIPLGAYDLYSAVQGAYANRLFFNKDTLASGHYSGLIVIGALCVGFLLLSLVGLQSGIHHLRQPTYSSARKLVSFWVFNAWFYGVFLLMLIRALSNGSYTSNGTPLVGNLSIWPFFLTIAVALVSYHDWTKRLRGTSTKPAA